MSGQTRSHVVVIRDSTPHDHWKPCLPPFHPPGESPYLGSASTRMHRLNDATLAPGQAGVQENCPVHGDDTAGNEEWFRRNL